MAAQKDQLRKQITETIAQPAAPFEAEIAEALTSEGKFEGILTSDQLAVIMRKVLYTLVAEQKVAGFEVPIVHNVSAMEVSIRDREARVFAEIHVHSPIIAFIQFRYTLENDSRNPGRKLHLKGNCLEEKEITRPFDLGAKAALAIMGVKQIALRELSDPNAVIQRTLPMQLELLGYTGGLSQVDLELLPNNTMRVFATAGTSA